jgi:hypothetical protein
MQRKSHGAVRFPLTKPLGDHPRAGVAPSGIATDVRRKRRETRTVCPFGTVIRCQTPHRLRAKSVA